MKKGEPKKVRKFSPNYDNIVRKSTKLTKEDEAYIESYVSGERMYINQVLRGNTDIYTDEDDVKLVKALDKVTDSELEAQTLYRSVDASAIFGNITDMEYDNLVSNIVYGDNQKLIVNDARRMLSKAIGTRTDKGFFSTTKDEGVAASWGGYTGSEHPIVLKVKVPKGTKGRDLQNGT